MASDRGSDQDRGQDDGRGSGGERGQEGGSVRTERLLAGRYRLQSVLGQGGMGTVWRAKDQMLGREVAVKQLRFEAGVGEEERRRLVARTLTEAKAIARIRHTAAVTVYDVVEEDDRPWIVMELVESRSLSEVIREDGVLTPRQAAEIGLELLGVLAEAHRSGILHRDVKPSNVLIGHEGRVVLTDFGIARVEGDPSVTSTGMLVGAPSYISPERARGRIPGAPADMWSLGATMYAMVQGRPPYDKGSALSTLTAVMTEELTPPANGGVLTPVIEGLLRKEPEDRFDEATTRRMLRAVLAEPEPDVPPVVEPAAAATPSAELPVKTPVGTPVGTPPLRAPAAEAASPAVRRAGGPRGRAVLLALVLLLLVAGAGVWVAVASHQGTSAGKGHTASNGGAASPSATPSAPAASHAPASGAASSAASTSAAAPASATASRSTAVGDYHQVQGPGGAIIEIPAGLTLVSRSTSSWRYRGPDGTLQIDWTNTPQKSAVGAWRTSEAQVSGSFPGYHRVALQSVAYRGWDAADWEWTYDSTSGGKTHALNRGFVANASNAYAIYWTAPDATWDGARNQELLSHFFSSFRPAS
jgi:hypothetical protein